MDTLVMATLAPEAKLLNRFNKELHYPAQTDLFATNQSKLVLAAAQLAQLSVVLKTGSSVLTTIKPA